ncbi:MAG TPA: hypothetical protein PLN48_04655 [Lachnospiraceae bacterium]|nr:hypothetical protein [Lachnospiraceae bacterium]
MQNDAEKSQLNAIEKVQRNDPEKVMKEDTGRDRRPQPERDRQEDTARAGCPDPERDEQDGQQDNAFGIPENGAGTQDQQKKEPAVDGKTRKLKEMMRHPPSFYDMDAEDEELSVYK